MILFVLPSTFRNFVLTKSHGMRALELLSPAKNLECGIAAIEHGADAVYIGAGHFGARAAAGNSLEDIQALCAYAHRFCARVYVTVNTIVYNDELEELERLLARLQAIGVDAVLVQDMAVLQIRERWLAEGKRFPIVHASTQTDNRTTEKVRWLHSEGFKRVVLARELSLEEIREIHAAVPDVELEAFVHGALCVSYSGVCYASQYCFGRSANRGECAQFCRMKFDLLDAEGRELAHQRHMLSLRDMCRIDDLEALADAGICSFKIEGRLKDVAYVKNVVSAYRGQIDKLVERYPEKYCRASLGVTHHHFTPNVRKSFNRGFTDYFLHGRSAGIASFDTPKAIGEPIGTVKELRRNAIVVAGTAAFSNGDGLCYLDDARELKGVRINRVENNCLYPQRMPRDLRVGMPLFRNYDAAFERQLSQKTAVRKIPIRMCWEAKEEGYLLKVSLVETNLSVEIPLTYDHQKAEKPQGENVRRQLSRLGDTHFECVSVETDDKVEECFVPSSMLADVRRKAIAQLMAAVDRRLEATNGEAEVGMSTESGARNAIPSGHLYGAFPYMYNVSNRLSRTFYAARGLENVHEAFEQGGVRSEKLLMQCRHCLKYELGMCPKDEVKKGRSAVPSFLRLADGRRFRLEFDCKHCQMNIYAED